MGKLTKEEITLAGQCLSFALEQGADMARITLTKSLLNLYGVLNGEIDKTSLALDRSIQLSLFVDGRFGTFSSNRLEKDELEKFISNAVRTVGMMEPDAFRKLPAAERLEKGAAEGTELGLYDPAYENMTAEKRLSLALGSMSWGIREQLGKGFEVISEEGEYSDSLYDLYTIDSQGLEARHTETSFEIGYECSVKDPEGRIYSGYWWDACPRLEDLDIDSCSRKAIERASSQINPHGIESGKYTVVVDSECASKLLTPVMNALGGYAIQQKNSFLDGSLGQKVFPDNLTILDSPREYGKTGSRLFDSEGVSTRECAVIEKGVVKMYFLNTYIAGKMNAEPTVEDITRAKVLPTGGCKTCQDVLAKAGDCIYVTGFNGGNSSAVTGNFSYGIEGFMVKDGKIQYPVHEMLMTGNFKELWNNLLAAAEDARECMSRIVPTLAFTNVNISA